MKRPGAGPGMRHVAPALKGIPACGHFQAALLGMRVEWRADAGNRYPSSGPGNLALHQVAVTPFDDAAQRLDHPVSAWEAEPGRFADLQPAFLSASRKGAKNAKKNRR